MKRAWSGPGNSNDENEACSLCLQRDGHRTQRNQHGINMSGFPEKNAVPEEKNGNPFRLVQGLEWTAGTGACYNDFV